MAARRYSPLEALRGHFFPVVQPDPIFREGEHWLVIHLCVLRLNDVAILIRRERDRLGVEFVSGYLAWCVSGFLSALELRSWRSQILTQRFIRQNLCTILINVTDNNLDRVNYLPEA